MVSNARATRVATPGDCRYRTAGRSRAGRLDRDPACSGKAAASRAMAPTSQGQRAGGCEAAVFT
jgi:hypothetical protein